MDAERRRSSSDRKRKFDRRISDDEIRRYLTKKAKEGDRFVWVKKIVRDVGQGVPFGRFGSKAEKVRRKERMAELKKLNKMREQRAQEKAQREEELSLLASQRARAEADEFQKKEAEFLLSQSKLRARIRLNEGRAKPIDLLIAYLEDSYEINIDPCAVFKGLSICEIESLREDIKMQAEFDKETATHIEYWEALLAVCDWELAQARRAGVLGIHQSVETDVRNVLEGKSCEELVTLESEIDDGMRSGSAKVVEFWEAVLKHLHIYKSKAFIKENHAAKTSKKHLQCLEQPLKDIDNLKLEESEPNKEDYCQEVEDEEAGSFSPQLLQADESAEAIDPEEDKAILQRKRLEVMKEQSLLQEEHWWYEKYRPRKPNYFNQVHTGYVWNKYNRVHYDHDNPPPKSVQGYKLNVFYPDLVDKSVNPVYHIEKDGDSKDTCILRFQAGPPYEDLAFRIVKEDWEYSGKRGFKCEFEGGVLKLYFNFKRFVWRR